MSNEPCRGLSAITHARFGLPVHHGAPPTCCPTAVGVPARPWPGAPPKLPSASMIRASGLPSVSAWACASRQMLAAFAASAVAESVANDGGSERTSTVALALLVCAPAFAITPWLRNGAASSAPPAALWSWNKGTLHSALALAWTSSNTRVPRAAQRHMMSA